MGVPTSEVGYIPAMPRREDHEVHKGHLVALGGERKKERQTDRKKEKKNFFPSENRSAYEIMWKNMEQPDRPQTTIRRMRNCMLGTQGYKHTQNM